MIDGISLRHQSTPMESVDLDVHTLDLFIEWVSHNHPLLAPESVEKANMLISTGEKIKFQKVIETLAPLIIDEDTKITSENCARILKYIENIYDGEKLDIMKELIEQKIVRDGEYFEVSFLDAASTDILKGRLKEREEERMLQIKPSSANDRRALFARAAMSRMD